MKGASTFLSHGLAEKPDWLEDPDIKTLFSCLKHAGIEGRFVGGCVRDSLLGRELHDFDIAVNVPPEQTLEALNRASIKAIPTGLSHGTITAVINHRPYELTSLRQDIETDGRHAIVAYTDDWQIDAARRDFTMNALYIDEVGQIYDYFNGVEDAKAGHVRFVGEASERLEEDVLRLLRFFRFSTHFSTRNYDQDLLATCKEFAPKLRNLAFERIWQEWSKLLCAENIRPTLEAMQQADIFYHIYKECSLSVTEDDVIALENLTSGDPLIRLAALHWNHSYEDISKVTKCLKFSKKETTFLRSLFRPHEALNQFETPAFFTLYEKLGPEVVNAIGQIEEAWSVVDGNTSDYSALKYYINTTGTPLFPILGRDVLKLGVVAGPLIGDYLNRVKIRWIESGFQLDHKECVKILEHFMEES